MKMGIKGAGNALGRKLRASEASAGVHTHILLHMNYLCYYLSCETWPDFLSFPEIPIYLLSYIYKLIVRLHVFTRSTCPASRYVQF